MRNVRPSWCEVAVDSRIVKATGPKGRRGTLRVEFLARIDGADVPFLTVAAIPNADGTATTWTVTRRGTGKVLFGEVVQQ